MPNKKDHKEFDFNFKNASNVNLWNPQSYSGKELDALFPAMENLEISIGSEYSLKHHFAHLKHFKLHEEYPGLFDLKSFGKKNPQLVGLEFAVQWDFDNMQQVNKMFPDLELLDVTVVDQRSHSGASKIKAKLSKWYKNVKSIFKKPAQTIRFKNVRNFAMNIDRYTGDLVANQVTSFEFDQLKSLKLVSPDFYFNHSLFDMVVKNRELTSVDFTSTQLTNSNIAQFAETLSKLEEVTFDCHNMTRVNEVLELLTETGVERVNLVIGQYDHGLIYKFLIGVWRFGEQNYGVDRSNKDTTILSFYRDAPNQIEVFTPNNQQEIPSEEQITQIESVEGDSIQI